MLKPRGEMTVETNDPDVSLYVEVDEEGVFLEIYRGSGESATSCTFVSYQTIADAFL